MLDESICLSCLSMPGVGSWDGLNLCWGFDYRLQETAGQMLWPKRASKDASKCFKRFQLWEFKHDMVGMVWCVGGCAPTSFLSCSQFCDLHTQKPWPVLQQKGGAFGNALARRAAQQSPQSTASFFRFCRLFVEFVSSFIAFVGSIAADFSGVEVQGVLFISLLALPDS